MKLHCPHCDALLAARMDGTDNLRCLACGRRFALGQARVADPGPRALTASKSLRAQLDKLARNGRATKKDGESG